MALTALATTGCSTGGTESTPQLPSDTITVTMDDTDTNETATTATTTVEATAAPTTVPPTTTTISLEQATNTWAQLVAGATFATTSPWRSGDDLYAVAHSDDSALLPPDGAGYALHTFDGADWKAVQVVPNEDCRSMPGSCTASVLGANTSNPVLYLEWCCPMVQPNWSGPIGSTWQVNAGRLEPAVDNNVIYATRTSDTTLLGEVCTKVWLFGTQDQACVEPTTSTYTVQDNGVIDITTSVSTQDASFSVCIASGGGECVERLDIRYDERCQIEPASATNFSLEMCEYGGWVSVAERRLAELGFAVITDGYYDPGERPSVVAFQQAYSLDPDGYIGPASWRALFPEYNCNNNPQAGMCQYGDTNNDGLFGPGDIFCD